jgi:hypothetical protein
VIIIGYCCARSFVDVLIKPPEGAPPTIEKALDDFSRRYASRREWARDYAG